MNIFFQITARESNSLFASEKLITKREKKKCLNNVKYISVYVDTTKENNA